MGDSDYSWTLLTLAETNDYIKKLGGVIELIDVTNATDATKSAADAAALPAYYRQHNIRPAWTNFDRSADRDAFITAGAGFGVYIVCSTPLATTIQAAIDYIQAHAGTSFAVNINWDENRAVDLSAFIPVLSGMGVKMFCYTVRRNAVDLIPEWADAYVSSDCNANYELWKKNVLAAHY
jgi:hypothetical protein